MKQNKTTQNRDKRYTIRLTKDEEEKMLSDMKSYDYLSAAKYIRDCILKKKVRVRNVTVTDRGVRNQINLLTEQVKKIGKNYNQIVRRYESLCNTKRPDGSTAVTSRNTVFFMDRLAKLTSDIKQQMDSIIQTVKLLEVGNRADKK